MVCLTLSNNSSMMPTHTAKKKKVTPASLNNYKKIILSIPAFYKYCPGQWFSTWGL